MATGFTLWFCLVGLYLIESLRLMAVRSLLFAPRLFGRGSYGRPPYTYPGNGRWAWTLLPVWPVRQPVVVCSQPLVAWGVDCFAPNVMFAQSAETPIAYEEVKSFSVDEKTLRVNGAKFVRCESEAEAERAREIFERLKALTPAKREAAIREFARAAFGEKAARDRIAAVAQATRSLRLLSNLLWWVVIVAFPLLLVTLPVPDAFVILGVGAIVLALAVAISVSFAMAGGTLYPEQRTKYRWKSVKFVVYPVGALRAVDELTLDCVAGIHPVVLSVMLGHGTDQVEKVKSLWRHARSEFPMSVQADAKAVACSLWFNAAVCAEMKKYLAEKMPAALKEEQVEPQNRNCLSYCPNCRTQYATKSGVCADCPGVALRAFTP